MEGPSIPHWDTAWELQTPEEHNESLTTLLKTQLGSRITVNMQMLWRDMVLRAISRVKYGEDDPTEQNMDDVDKMIEDMHEYVQNLSPGTALMDLDPDETEDFEDDEDAMEI